MQELRRTNQDLTPDNFLSVEQRQLDDYIAAGQGEQRYSPSTSTATNAPSGKDFGGDVGMEKMAGIADEVNTVFKKFIKCKMGLRGGNRKKLNSPLDMNILYVILVISLGSLQSDHIDQYVRTLVVK